LLKPELQSDRRLPADQRYQSASDCSMSIEAALWREQTSLLRPARCETRIARARARHYIDGVTGAER
jgi:hypothetical protein